MLTKDELLTKLTSIGTLEDDAERRTLLTEISEDLALVYDENESLTKANTDYEANVKKLQEHNMKLYLKTIDQQKPVPQQEKPKQSENLKYENLFNDKGELI